MSFRLCRPGPALAAFLLFSCSWLALIGPARATHIVGGEMELIYNSGNSYTLALNLYFDAVNGSATALDGDLTASIFEKSTNKRMANVLLPLASNTFVNYSNPACTRPTLSTRKLVYSRNITLAADTYNSAQGYYVAVERCCRNVSIGNIVAPYNAAQTFYLEFPAVVRNGQPFIDSTPRIFPPLADYACVNELFYYEFGGVDINGDSLVYALITPLNGHANGDVPKPAVAAPAPYAPITWLPPAPAIPGVPSRPPLGPLNQIPGSPTLAINPATGRLTVRPLDQGLFVFGVSCSEYRNGEKIGETRRDFQLMVLSCAANAKPKLLLLPNPPAKWCTSPGATPCAWYRAATAAYGCVLRIPTPGRSCRCRLAQSIFRVCCLISPPPPVGRYAALALPIPSRQRSASRNASTPRARFFGWMWWWPTMAAAYPSATPCEWLSPPRHRATRHRLLPPRPAHRSRCGCA
jgi:hypothetical protein